MRMFRPGRFAVLFALGFCPLALLPAANPAAAQELEQNWTHYVRIGGYGLRADNADSIVRDAGADRVFGIETDNDIPGRYDSFLDPEAKLRAIRAVAKKAHAAGNKAFVYIAGLECITADARRRPHSFFKDHADWVQRRITGEPAVFGGGSAFWIRKGDEDVWISPYAPEWRRRYMRIIRQIAGTGIDGIYVDIPYWMTHFEGWEDTWASFDNYTVAEFKARSGLDARKDVRLGDFRDPGFRRWVDFRIETLTGFMAEIDQNAKAVNRECMTIAEIYPGLGEEVVRVGADVYGMYRAVDAIAHEYHGSGPSMAASKSPLDWFEYMIGMYSFRAFAGPKATWMLSYSWDGQKDISATEAMKNLFVAEITAGANVWDARGHVMSGSNDPPTRKKVFAWIEQNEERLYHPRVPVQPAGVYFSPRTRNYFAREFLESYKGTLSLLLHSHREFQIVTPRTLREFGGAILFLPDVRCLDETELDALELLLASGRKLVVTGETGRYTGSGERRTENPLLRLLDIRDADAPQDSSRSGKAFVYRPDCPGRAYLRQLGQEFNEAGFAGSSKGRGFERLRSRFDAELTGAWGYRPAVEVEASPFVAAQIARVDGKIHVFLANFKGLAGGVNAEPFTEHNIRVRFPASAGSRVYALPFLGTVSELTTVKKTESGVSAVIPELGRGMVVWCE